MGWGELRLAREGATGRSNAAPLLLRAFFGPAMLQYNKHCSELMPITGFSGDHMIDPKSYEILRDENALMARKLMHEGMSRGWRLWTNDAVHLASAQWVGASELQTYDLGDFEKFSQLVGIEIREPDTIQPKLF